MSSELPATVTIPATVAWQQVGDEIVLLDVNGGEYHNLNDVASHMWRALEASGDVEAAYALLSDAYEVDPETLRRDLGALIRQLVEKGLLSTP